MSFVIPFSFDKAIVRIVLRDEEPWFVAADVCKALEVGNPTMALSRLDDDERTLISIEGASNGLPVNAVNESGLYSLIMGCRKAEAKRFKKWVTAEVLPSIRKTGRFEVAPQNAIPQTLSEALRLAADLADQKQGVEAKLLVAAHKAGAFDRLATANESLCINDAAKFLQIAPKRLFLWLDVNGWTYRRRVNASRMGYQTKVEAGLIEHKIVLVDCETGSMCRTQVRITPKGLARLAEKFALPVAA